MRITDFAEFEAPDADSARSSCGRVNPPRASEPI
jgi:hypothetical protein